MLPTRVTRSTARNIVKKDAVVADVNKQQNKKEKNKLHVPTSKRIAEKSPEECPQLKRSVFNDLTNARKEESLVENVKVAQNNKAKLRKSSVASIERSSAENSICSLQANSQFSIGSSSSNTFYATAEESLTDCSTRTILESEDQPVDILELSPAISTVKQNSKSSSPVEIPDFDAENIKDPFSASQYAVDIFEYFREREVKFIVSKYMHKQKEITKTMRSILVDWIVEVQEGFELNHETLYLAVRLVDIYLSKRLVPKEMLQLVGSAAVFVACKYDERCPPAIDDFLYICDDAYTRQQMVLMEMSIIKTLEFDLGVPLSYTFLRRYSRCSKQSLEMLTLARYILEMSLMEYEFVDVPDSLMAAAALSLALQMKNLESWSPVLEHYSGYQSFDFFDLKVRLNHFLTSVIENKHLHTIRNKYSHEVFYSVAKIPLLEHIKEL